MKRIIVSLSILFSVITAMAQDNVGVYHSTFFDKDYDISASYSSSNQLNVYIQVAGEHSSDDVKINLEGKEIEEFISALKQVKEKFLEWKSIAIKNNVKSMSKEFDIAFPRVSIAWYGSQWWFCFSHRLTPRFIVTDSGQPIFVMSDKVSSSSNEYIDTRYYFALSAASDFDEVLQAISPANIENKLSKKQDVEDLFK